MYKHSRTLANSFYHQTMSLHTIQILADLFLNLYYLRTTKTTENEISPEYDFTLALKEQNYSLSSERFNYIDVTICTNQGPSFQAHSRDILSSFFVKSLIKLMLIGCQRPWRNTNIYLIKLFMITLACWTTSIFNVH